MVFGRKFFGWAGMGLVCFGASACYGQSGVQALGQFEGQGDYGVVLHPGAGVYDAAKGSYTVTGSGANLWFGIDDFHFVWKKMAGDVAFSADIDFVGAKGNAHRKAVLMMRQSLDPHAVYADVAVHGDGLTSLQYRDGTGENTHEVETYAKGPHRVRIEKRGEYAYVSIPDADGKMVASGAAIRVGIAGDFYVGLGVCSHDEKVTETAVFSNVRIEPLAAAGKPVLHSTLETVLVGSGDRRVRYTAVGSFEDPNWTADGKALIFDQGGTLQRLELDNGVHPIDSTVPRATTTSTISIVPAMKVNGDHGISPDGSLIAVGDDKARIYVVPVGGGTAKLVTADGSAYFHGWSPDGKTISYTATSGDVFAAYTVPVMGGTGTLLAAKSDSAEFSADGVWVYFQSDRTGHMQVWRMHLDGSAAGQMVVSETTDWFPHISPDGKMVVFLAYKAGTQGHPPNLDVELRVLTVGDRKVRTLAKLLGGRGTMNVPSWSPDGKMVAFASYAFLAE